VKQALLSALGVVVVAATLGIYLWNGGGGQLSSARADDDGARAVLRNAAGQKVGTAKFAQEDDGVHVKVRIDAPLATLAAGFHGFHVHSNDNPANGTGCLADPTLAETTWFVSTDGHYKDADPAHTHHGAHNGDLPVLLVNDNGAGRVTGEARFVTDRFNVGDIVGRALIAHKLPDNYRNIPVGAGATQYQPVTDNVADSTTATGLTAATGNAGPRMACGAIEGSD